jgi:hypothetical protein
MASHGPPAWDDAPEPTRVWDLRGKGEPDFDFDRRVAL